MGSLRGEMQWRAKVGIQFVLARLPWAEALNYKLGALLRPAIHRPETLRRRIPAYLAALEQVGRHRAIKGATVFELGTGWCPIAPTLLHLAGAGRIITVDKVPHARFELALAAVAACRLEGERIATVLRLDPQQVTARLDALAAAPDLGAWFSALGAEYRAPFDAQATGLPAGSVDIWYSYSVLENIPAFVVDGILTEAARILKRDGVWFSVIGCQDPFASGVPGMSHVNYLRFEDGPWGFWTHNQLAYNNRLREVDFVRRLEGRGLAVRHLTSARDAADLATLAKLPLADRFKGYTPEELAVYRSEITATPGERPSA